MIEWMHDEEILSLFQNDFSKMTEEDVRNFIMFSFTKENQHFAIVDNENDEYLGTISLKNINIKNRNAEFAICTRKKIRGCGVNNIAVKLLINYAFNNLKLHKIYLNVLSSNLRAKKFYEKMDFKYEGTFKNHIYIQGKYEDLEWYGIINE